MIPDAKDIKITLRISEEDLDQIDSFLEENPKHGNRSEFLRNCALDSISRIKNFKGDGQAGPKFTDRENMIMEKMIDMGYYYNMDDVVRSIVDYCFDTGVIKAIFEDKINRFNQIENSISRGFSIREEKVGRL
ncbi:MAG: ribbon-helix-helix domain-containing protein [Candidatus Thermoplasmatota archaeon]|jgi:Arc/MetJ-type ribon-helix-helix transcriptional regulator|nr:ribbon-helix-helix domain-containing protein [Candidatus Thermoplasmatota archaeon]MCL5988016.1 ribbon-helix-helix domain-containing protein [Candidatus Thermoplasmatota archaeon]